MRKFLKKGEPRERKKKIREICQTAINILWQQKLKKDRPRQKKKRNVPGKTQQKRNVKKSSKRHERKKKKHL